MDAIFIAEKISRLRKTSKKYDIIVSKKPTKKKYDNHKYKKISS